MIRSRCIVFISSPIQTEALVPRFNGTTPSTIHVCHKTGPDRSHASLPPSPDRLFKIPGSIAIDGHFVANSLQRPGASCKFQNGRNGTLLRDHEGWEKRVVVVLRDHECFEGLDGLHGLHSGVYAVFFCWFGGFCVL